MNAPTQHLISTKLYRPLARENLVRRPRLLDVLNRGVVLPLTLVSAPAGSGKTTLISDWLATCSCPSVWVSLDEGDSDLAGFLDYFIAAIRTVIPDALETILEVLQTAQLPPVRVLAGMLINEIESLSEGLQLTKGRRFVLVLDDYHLIRGQAVNALLTEILRHPPQGMHLVLLSRSDPALPIASLRARGLVIEIRTHDLRFTVAETKAYLQGATQESVSDEITALLVEKTEGWITGLHLVVLSMRRTDTLETISDTILDVSFVLDYLLHEVIDHQPPEIQQFLLKTAVLDQLCGSLCDAVIGLDGAEYDGQTFLERLMQSNLFVESLHNQPQWYRYHHLFQKFLRYQLHRQFGPSQIANLHRRASEWYDRNGYVEDAITHALAAGDEAGAVQIIEARRHETMNQEQ